MSIKSKVLAAAATLTLVGGVGAAGALAASPANAATASCGYGFAERCINIYNFQFGRNFLLDTFQQGERVNQPIILFQASNIDPAEDFTASDLVVKGRPMTVNELQALDPIFSPATLVQYGYDDVYEFQYAPYGVDSGLCVGVKATAGQGEPVSLQPCGVSANTVWIVDRADTFLGGTVPLINGSNANFTHPYVLTYPAYGYPTDRPRPQLTVTELQTYSNYPHVAQNQLWGAFIGPVR
ncbi:MAG: hypothetical protein JO132_17950 [Streptosporangiaceae bacterium]|nr:hypothetical protein [Streptosporangiaceae bacterium]